MKIKQGEITLTGPKYVGKKITSSEVFIEDNTLGLRNEFLSIQSVNPPTYVGAYVIGGGNNNISFSLGIKPSYLNRFFCKWCLGWKWKDN